VPDYGRQAILRIPQVSEATPIRRQVVPLDEGEPESSKESHVPEHRESNGWASATCYNSIQARGCERRTDAPAAPLGVDGKTVQVSAVAHESNRSAAYELSLRVCDDVLSSSEEPSTRPPGASVQVTNLTRI
jgi:hypothetical protein